LSILQFLFYHARQRLFTARNAQPLNQRLGAFSRAVDFRRIFQGEAQNGKRYRRIVVAGRHYIHQSFTLLKRLKMLLFT